MHGHVNRAATKPHDGYSILPKSVAYHRKRRGRAVIRGEHPAISSRVLPIDDLHHVEQMHEGKQESLIAWRMRSPSVMSQSGWPARLRWSSTPSTPFG
jgi:hypothetical protein